jgi:signal transduction histidine kinase
MSLQPKPLASALTKRSPLNSMDRRRPGSPRNRPSLVIGRLCIVLLVAPWVLILALKNIFALDTLTSSMFFFVLCSELAIVTLAGLALVNARLKDLRQYESGREHERLLFSYSRDGMLLVRVLKGPGDNINRLAFFIQAENPTAIERLSSIGQAASYVGREIDEAFPRWLRHKIRREYTACVRSQRVHRYEVCHPDGTLAHESIATPVIDPASGSVTHIVVIMRDIGERIAHERQLAIALTRAETANKTKSEFLASMSHELRTPLNAVLGFSEALTEGICGPLAAKQKEYIQHIHQSGSHLLSIISDILDLSKVEAGHVVLQEAEIVISQLVDACILMVKERVQLKTLAIKIQLAPGLPKIVADPLRLKQILINLLSNAIKFTDKGTITLTVDYNAAAGFEFAVTDTGIGMTADEIGIALQPFGQVQGAFARNHDGTGLGLPIAQQLAVLHGGKLQLSSRPGLGTRVSIILPPGRAVSLGAAEHQVAY